MQRRHFLALTGAVALPSLPLHAATTPTDTLFTWYRLVLELVRHTATYSVAARAFGYLGIATYEAIASGTCRSLAGQINGLTTLPPAPQVLATRRWCCMPCCPKRWKPSLAILARRVSGRWRRCAISLVRSCIRALPKMSRNALPPSGLAVAQHIEAYSKDDGGANIDNMASCAIGRRRRGRNSGCPPARRASRRCCPHGRNRPWRCLADASCIRQARYRSILHPRFRIYAQAMEVYTVSCSTTSRKPSPASGRMTRCCRQPHPDTGFRSPCKSCTATMPMPCTAPMPWHAWAWR